MACWVRGRFPRLDRAGNPSPTTGDGWQTAVINFPLPGDIGSPKDIGEEYRRNTPVLYYAMDANFTASYFGSNGVAAVDGAFAILNGLTNVSSYSPSLSEFPLNSGHYNPTATGLELTDLKSEMLGLVVEEMGLVDPVAYTWTLHTRTVFYNLSTWQHIRCGVKKSGHQPHSAQLAYVPIHTLCQWHALYLCDF